MDKNKVTQCNQSDDTKFFNSRKAGLSVSGLRGTLLANSTKVNHGQLCTQVVGSSRRIHEVLYTLIASPLYFFYTTASLSKFPIS